MELWDWLWTEVNPRTGEVRGVMRSPQPHFSGDSARNQLVERLRFMAGSVSEYGKAADLLEAATPPLAATVGTAVLAVAKVGQDGFPLPYGNFAAKQSAALSPALKDKRSPRVW